MNKAKIVADSVNTFGQRITSMVITFPRYLLAELNTHRALSRNSASSRAIRFDKMVKSVQDNPFLPSRWQKDHPGMQGTEYFGTETASEAWLHLDRAWGYGSVENEPAISFLEKEWLEARDNAIMSAKRLNELGVTKQICNRLLEPYMYHTALITATEWENFFALRAHKDAEINFQDLAEKMLAAMNESMPKQLKAGEYHIPFGDQFDNEKIIALAHDQLTKFKPDFAPSIHDLQPVIDEIVIKLATVSCARISYLNHDKRHDYEADLKLHDRLASSGHWSAFEHCAKAMTDREYYDDDRGIGKSDKDAGWCGNFRGFIQYRKMFTDENRTDSRLIKK